MNHFIIEASIFLTGFWFRIFGYGFFIGFSRPLPSEKFGQRKSLVRIGLFNMKLLTPEG